MWIADTYLREDLKDKTIPKGVRAFLRCIGSESPVASYLPPSLKCANLIDKIIEKRTRQTDRIADDLQYELPIFFNLLKDIRMDLPDAFNALLLHLKDVSLKPFETPVPQKIPELLTSDVLCW